MYAASTVSVSVSVAGRSPARPAEGRFLPFALALSVAFWMAAACVLSRTPEEWDHVVGRQWVLDPPAWWPALAYGAAIAAFAVLAGERFRSESRSRRNSLWAAVRALAVLGGVLLLAGGAWGVAWLAPWPPARSWTIGDPVNVGPETYAEATTGSEAAIFRRAGWSWGRRRYEVVARGFASPAKHGACVLFPEGRAVPAGLVVAPGGTLCARIGSRVFAAFDPASARAFTRDELAHLSPFVLLAPGERGTQASVELLAGAVHDFSETGADFVDNLVPAPAVVAEGLRSADPWVRAVAQRVADEGGERVYPGLAKR